MWLCSMGSALGVGRGLELPLVPFMTPDAPL